MRTWGRVDGVWQEVSTSPSGDNTMVYLTTLIQVLKLNLGESPFYGDWGIPAEQSVTTQVPPDFYVILTQQRFAQYFSTLLVSKAPAVPNAPKPTYNIAATSLQGGVITSPVPQ